MTTPADEYEGMEHSLPKRVDGLEGMEDPLAALPEVEPGPDGGGEAYDPVLELTKLLTGNAEAMNELSQQGVELKDSHTMISQMLSLAFMEEILRTLAGEGAVTRVMLQTHQQISDTLKAAKSQVAQAMLAAPLSAGMPNREQRRHP